MITQDTIFALSSGSPPAAIAIIRVSGPDAASALVAVANCVPPARRAVSAFLRDAHGAVLDRALLLWLPGPSTATGEDIAEFHLHGGRAVVRAVEAALELVPGLRRASAGEFTRRAFLNGRIDLAEAEGLADLLSAETELQRQAAMAMAGGRFSKKVGDWRERLLALSAQVEAVLDFDDEDDVGGLTESFTWNIGTLQAEITDAHSQPSAELLREGFRVVLAGPPNAGKSTLFNALVQAEAAITSPIEGTTRDVISRPVAFEGVPFLFVDTAGLRGETSDTIEALGITRARGELDRADLVLWLGPDADCPPCAWNIAAQVDRAEGAGKTNPRHRVSAVTGVGLEDLQMDLIATARAALPRPGEVALSQRQRHLLRDADQSLSAAGALTDPLLVAENLRLARLAFDALLGRTTTEDMLDTLFGRFCIGK
jgi:tRNA modification GTPase